MKANTFLQTYSISSMNSIQFISESERVLHTCCSKSMKSIQFISESGQLSVEGCK